jgi:hypothetical protein
VAEEAAPVSHRARRLSAWALLGTALGCLVGIAVLAAATAFRLDSDEAPLVLVALSFAVVGAVVALGAPRNSIGWLLLAIGLGLALLGVTQALVEVELASRGSVPAASAIAWLSPSIGFAALLAIMALLPRLPSGTFLSRRWRVADALAVAAFVAGSAASFDPGPIADHPEFDNPLGIAGFDTVNSVLEPIALVLLLALLVVSLGSVVVRFRRARGIERLQLKWVGLSIAVTVVLWLAALAFSFSDSDSLIWVVWSLSLCTVPASIGIAVLRYRLYDIDRVISKTLVYGSLTVVLGAAYAGLVLAGQWLFSSFAGGSDLAIAVSTLLVAALFLPVRSRLQRLVDRRFYRRRYDAQRTLEAFGARLREQVELDALAADLRAVVAETMEPVHVSLWRRESTA